MAKLDWGLLNWRLLRFGPVLAVAWLAVGWVQGGEAPSGAIEDGLGDRGLWKLVGGEWTWDEGVLKQSQAATTAGAELLARKYLKWPGYAVRVKVRVSQDDPARPGGYDGLVVKGVNYVMRKDGAWAVYPGKEGRMEGTFEGLSVPEGRWFDIRVVAKGGKIRGFLDGKPWLALGEAPSPGARVKLISCHLSGGFRDFSLTPLWEEEEAELAEIGSGKNLLVNSSFEAVVEDLPVFWRPATHVHAWPSEAEYFESFAVVEEGAHHGARCVRLVTKSAANPAGATLMDNVNLRNQVGVFSVYLRAAAEDTPVELSVTYVKKKVAVGTEWARFSLATQKPRGKLRAAVTALAPGTVWVDAAQFEVGGSATDYVPRPVYEEAYWLKPTEDKPRAAIVTYKVRLASSSPKLDGVLDEKCWRKAAELAFGLCRDGARPRDATVGKIVCDQDALYVAFRCSVPPERVIPTDAAARRSPWATDNVELLVDPTGLRRGVCQMAANLAGARAGSRGRMGTAQWRAWLGEWSVAAARSDDGYCVELRAPFAVLDLDENTPRSWPFNLARSGKGEVSCTSPPGIDSFHEVKAYDELELPRRLKLRRFAVGVREVKLIAAQGEGGCTLAGRLRNASGRQGTFTVAAQWNGAPVGEALQVTVPADGDVPLAFPGVKLPGGATEATFEIRIRNAAGDLLRIAEVTAAATKPLAVFPERSFFSNEPEIRVCARLCDPAATGRPATGEAALLRDGQVAARTTASGVGGGLTFAFPLAGREPGQYAVEVSVSCGGATLTAKTSTLVRPHVPGETKLDHLRRCMVIDGRPRVLFMPLVMTYHNTDEKFWRFFAERNIRDIMLAPGRPHIKLLGEYLGKAETAGVNVFCFCHVDAELVRRPNLLGWLVVDEPSGAEREKEVIATVRRARETDPHHVIYCNHFPHTMAANYAGLPGDVISIDYYPIPCPGRSIREVGALTRRMEQFARPRRLPTWFFVQGSGIHSREPTALELSAQTYLVLANGGTGVQYFFGEPHGRRAWQRFLELAEEIRQLNDVLLSTEERPAFSQRRPDDVHALARRLHGAGYVVAVNGAREAIEEEFTLPGAAGKAEVLFENRQVPVKDGRLSDRFGPLERHVYRFTLE